MPDVQIPTSPQELEEMLLDSNKMQDLFKNPKAFGEFITNYGRAALDKDQSIATQVREETQRVLGEFLKTQKNNVPVNLNPLDGVPNYYQARKNALYNKAAVGASVDKLYSSQGDFFRSISPHAQNFRDAKVLIEKKGQLQEIMNSFGSNVPADGGFLVPEILRSDLLQISLETSQIRPRATVIPMGSQKVLIPFVDSTSNVTSVLGGWTAQWVDEATAPTESQAKFGAVALDAKKLMLYSSCPNELVADGVGFSAFLEQGLPKAIAFEEDYRFMQGTGIGEPLGMVNCPAAVIATAQVGQGANTIVVENLANMFARMLPSSLNNAVWFATIDAFPQLATMALSVGTGGAPVFLTNGSVAGAAPMTIYGRPLYFTEKLPGLGTTGDICFVDPSYYLVGDRQLLQVTASTDFLFSTDKTAYKVIERVDGRPWLQSAITQKNNSANTLSAFVQLSSTRT
jgi:HK97 family phage major capsid protein